MKETWKGLTNIYKPNYIEFPAELDMEFRETEDMSQVSDLSNLVDQFKYVKQVNIGSRAFFQGSMLVYQSEFSRDKEPIREKKMDEGERYSVQEIGSCDYGG